jgi:transcriptional/translational regulatory protein YebC/TACO1
MSDFGTVQAKLQELAVEPVEAGLQRVPNMTKPIGENHIKGFLKLIDGLEDDDDVQKVYHNADIDEALLEKYL